MMSAEQNERLTRVGPGTPGGAMLRRHWQPVALVDELDGPRPVRPVRALGQDMVLFRDEAGRIGLIDRGCPHRGADMAYGRLEDGGLRCAFHGWLFDVDGKVPGDTGGAGGQHALPAHPHAQLPGAVRSGIVFAYLGPGEAPALPGFDCFVAPTPTASPSRG
jgi:phenylpropionate dioxygenase-like ring-hydroxylating dioxygenase large terminal subunit